LGADLLSVHSTAENDFITREIYFLIKLAHINTVFNSIMGIIFEFIVTLRKFFQSFVPLGKSGKFPTVRRKIRRKEMYLKNSDFFGLFCFFGSGTWLYVSE
jgi:hypothetical protein